MKITKSAFLGQNSGGGGGGGMGLGKPVFWVAQSWFTVFQKDLLWVILFTLTL